MVDGTETNAALTEKLGLSFPILSDADLGTIRAYGLEEEGKDISLPATVVVKQGGTVQWIYVGDKASDRPLVPDVLSVLGD